MTNEGLNDSLCTFLASPLCENFAWYRNPRSFLKQAFYKLLYVIHKLAMTFLSLWYNIMSLMSKCFTLKRFLLECVSTNCKSLMNSIQIWHLFLLLSDSWNFQLNYVVLYQVAPCARALNDKTAYFETTRARQNKVIETLAGLSRLEILSRVMDDEVARKDLKNLTRTFELVIEASIDPFKDVSSVQSCENSPQKDVLSTWSLCL